MRDSFRHAEHFSEEVQLQDIYEVHGLHTMAKKGKLLAALDSHKGRDYAAEKEKKQRKQAEKKKRLNETGTHKEEVENQTLSTIDKVPVLQTESEGWESDESEAAQPMTVFKSLATSLAVSPDSNTDQCLCASR